MTLLRAKSGIYIGEFEYAWYGPDKVRLSLGTRKAKEARERHDAVLTAFGMKERGRAIIDELRKGKASRLISPEALAQMKKAGDAFVLPSAPSVPAKRRGGETVGQAAARYLDWLARHPRRSRGTHEVADSGLKRFLRSTHEGRPIADLPLDAVTSAVFETYQQSLVDAGTPKNTITNYAGRVRALWRWLDKQEQRAAREERRPPRPVFNPVDPEMVLRDSVSRDRRLSEEEAERLLAATPEPLLCAVAIGLFAGFRLNEVLHLRPGMDIDLALGTLAVQRQGDFWRPKTKRSERVVPITADLKPIIEHQLQHYASERWLVPSLADPELPFVDSTFMRHFSAIVVRAGLVPGRKDPAGVVFHTLRHTFASWLAMRSVDLYTIAQLLGDSLAMVEKVYARLSPDFKKLAMSKLSGAVKLPEIGRAA